MREGKSSRQEPSVRKKVSRAFDEEGSTLIETSFVLIVLLTIIFGIMEFGRFMYVYHFASEVAREATRYAVVRGATWSTACASPQSLECYASATNVSAYVQTLTPTSITSATWSSTCGTANVPVVCTTWPGTLSGAATTCPGASPTTGIADSPGCLVEVQVSLPFQFYLPFMPNATYTIQSTSEMVISQ
jgi:Flp pilus assembly protein TadG